MVAADSQHDVTRLLPLLDVPRRLDHLLQGVGPINDRPILARLDQPLEEEKVLLGVPSDPHDHSLIADPVGQERQERRMRARQQFEAQWQQASGQLDQLIDWSLGKTG